MAPDVSASAAHSDFESTALDDTLQQNREAIEHSRRLSSQRAEQPAQVPGLTILKCLGEGAFGSVWLAREQNTGKQVAVKFYTHRRGLDWSLLNREVEKLAVLYTSRNIVGLLGVGWDSDPPYYVMEYLENGSLESYLADGPLPPQEAVCIARGVLSALVHAHGSGILHCDLKPANVLLGSDFEPRLCDFGQSRLSDEQDPALGTFFYMAPEQADLKSVPDARWDVYALGALVFHLLCGRPPFRTEETERLLKSGRTLEDRLAIYRRIVRNSPRPAAHRKAAGVDKRLADIVDRCLHPDPQKRFPNAQAVLDMLELRDRQRSRRPLIALGVVGPALLLAAMLPIARNAMQTAVQTAERNLTDRALESDVVSVNILARSIERELDDRKEELVEIAAEPALRKAVVEANGRRWDANNPLVELLAAHKKKVDDSRRAKGRELDTSWFLTDAKGDQAWREPLNPETIGKNWSHRDYFHGLDREIHLDNKPADIMPIESPHVSLAFRSAATKRYMVAISVPVWDLENARVIGVLARTIHLGQLLSAYEASIRGQEDDEVNRVIALVDRRDGNLLDHPWMTQENLTNLLQDKFSLLNLKRVPGDQLNRIVPHDAEVATQQRDANWQDPVGLIDAQAYGGEWLAAFSPVGSTSWTAVVQERRAAALKPVAEMQSRLIQYGVTALAVGSGLVGLLWYFVLRALNDRTLRNWSRSGGLRNSGTPSNTTGTGIQGNGI